MKNDVIMYYHCPVCRKFVLKKDEIIVVYPTYIQKYHKWCKRKYKSLKKRIRSHCIDCGIGLTGYKARRCRKHYAIFRRNDPEIDRKQYRRNWTIKKKYGMDPDEFEAYWLACRGKCWICGKKMLKPTSTQGQGLDVVAIDHDHKTGKIRALLCNSCNKGLGFFNDDINLLGKAIKYLKG